jgi:hypothetical protein
MAIKEREGSFANARHDVFEVEYRRAVVDALIQRPEHRAVGFHL